MGTSVISETTGGQKIAYRYDSNNKPVAINVGNVEYYYVYNTQGDVIALVDTNGAVVAQYSYDAWGDVTSIKDGAGQDVSGNVSHVANVNPYRYRGYRWDSEIQMYYLMSRYYSPEWGRFLNFDDVTIIQENSSKLLSGNGFAYCGNNAVMRWDPTGYRLKSVLEGRKIVIDAGHGGYQLGATYIANMVTFFFEKDFNLRVAKRVAELLRIRRATVYMTRTTDKTVSLESRYQLANNKKADLFVSIHHNSTNPFKSGFEVLYAGKHDTVFSRYLATRIDSKLKSYTSLNRHASPHSREDLAVLNGTKMPAVLVECGFMNGIDIRYLMTKYNTIARAIYSGIKAYHIHRAQR